MLLVASENWALSNQGKNEEQGTNKKKVATVAGYANPARQLETKPEAIKY